MRRTLMSDLIAWKDKADRKPLVLEGARRTGKTWLLRELGRTSFDSVVEVNLRTNLRARDIFSDDFDTDRIVSALSAETGTRIERGKTLLILDEIQEAPRAVASLEHFCKDMRDLHVAAARSYRPSATDQGLPFPTDCVEPITLEPLSFLEFLDAIGQEGDKEVLLEKGPSGIDLALANKLEGALKEYLYVGGMPEAVVAYASSHDYSATRDAQEKILETFDLDFSRHAPIRMLERIRLVWEGLPAQLSREKKKFVYGVVRPGARARDFEESIQWLADYGAVRRVWRSTALRSPLSSYRDAGAFKLFCVDVGLFGALAHLDARTVADASSIFTDLNGAYTEQYVCQQLATLDMSPSYWSSGRGRSEVDLVVEVTGTPVPIEVQATENLQTKSLKVVRDRFRSNRCVRTSLAGFRDEGWLVNIPLWAIGSSLRTAITR